MLILKGKSLGDSGRNQRKDRSKSINHCPVVIVEVSSSGAVWKVRTDIICFRRLVSGVTGRVSAEKPVTQIAA